MQSMMYPCLFPPFFAPAQNIYKLNTDMGDIQILNRKFINDIASSSLASGASANLTSSWTVPQDEASKAQDGVYEYWVIPLSTGWGTIREATYTSVSGTTVTAHIPIINTSPEAHTITVDILVILVDKSRLQ